MAEQISFGFSASKVQSRLQQRASMTDGPAEPSVCKAQLLIISGVMLSNRIGL